MRVLLFCSLLIPCVYAFSTGSFGSSTHRSSLQRKTHLRNLGSLANKGRLHDTPNRRSSAAVISMAEKGPTPANTAGFFGDEIDAVTMTSAVNLAVISFVAAGAVFKLATMGADPQYVIPWIRESDTIEYLFQLPGANFLLYEDAVRQHPVFYKACTSGVAYCLGDFTAQIYQGRRLDTLDLPRSFRSGVAGFVGHGPLCHFWMVWMENNLSFGGAWWAVLVKVFADQTVWSIYLNAMYSSIIGALQFHSPQRIWKDVSTSAVPAIQSSWRFWPFIHLITFGGLIPLDLRLLFVDCMEIIWVTILSQVANQDNKEGEIEGEEAPKMSSFVADDSSNNLFPEGIIMESVKREREVVECVAEEDGTEQCETQDGQKKGWPFD